MITGYMRGMATVLMAQDTVTGVGTFYSSWGEDPHYTKLHFEKYAKLNPAVVPMNLNVKPGEVCSLSTLIPRNQFLKSRPYQEWAQPQGYADTTNALIEKSATSVAHLATAYHLRDCPADDETRRRMRLIAPHVCRAVAISKIIDLNKIEAAMLADAVDGVAAGVLLVRVDGEIAYTNASAQAMLRELNVLRESRGVLKVFDPTAQKALGDAFTAAAGGDIALGRRGIAVPMRSRDGENYDDGNCAVEILRRRVCFTPESTFVSTRVAAFESKHRLARPSSTRSIRRRYPERHARIKVCPRWVRSRGYWRGTERQPPGPNFRWRHAGNVRTSSCTFSKRREKSPSRALTRRRLSQAVIAGPPRQPRHGIFLTRCVVFAAGRTRLS
jgi:hypothetical protein